MTGNRRTYLLGAALGVAAAIVAIAIAVSQHSGAKTKVSGGRAGVAEVTRELAGIPQSGITLGQASAPVTVTEYADLQCPICQEFNTGTLTQLVANEVRAGKVKVVFRNLETATPDAPTFKTEAVAALAAGKQNRLWNYVELFYRNQGEEGSGYVTDAFLTGLAQSLPGLNLAKWKADRADSALGAQVGSDASLAAGLGFNATPSLLVKGPRFPSHAIAGAASYPDLQKAIKSVSAQE
jgi:protein-disulfide isomerase